MWNCSTHTWVLVPILFFIYISNWTCRQIEIQILWVHSFPTRRFSATLTINIQAHRTARAKIVHILLPALTIPFKAAALDLLIIHLLHRMLPSPLMLVKDLYHRENRRCGEEIHKQWIWIDLEILHNHSMDHHQRHLRQLNPSLLLLAEHIP